MILHFVGRGTEGTDEVVADLLDRGAVETKRFGRARRRRGQRRTLAGKE